MQHTEKNAIHRKHTSLDHQPSALNSAGGGAKVLGRKLNAVEPRSSGADHRSSPRQQASLVVLAGIQGYLDNNKQPPPPEPP